MSFNVMFSLFVVAAACFIEAVFSKLVNEFGRRRIGRHGYPRLRVRGEFEDDGLKDDLDDLMFVLGCVNLLAGLAIGLVSGDLWILAGAL
ncbi:MULTISPECIES: hypothetical protein [Bifidobacterium]|uniref:Uncharacterized protein n=2 Tax=Bifidobacterium TaxID=1678 RepID=A0A261FNH7_9BIFI|nr:MULTISPECIES: hypothetical protein [Bifidobacterium]OZG60731.1 hypothetical protein BLEM_1700 [Bifidobacterium lemurum]OZG69629.1 hypothetical protein BEUL_0046 [Bifidobacterium eulemuris]QOL32256.1 hypothetical protein BE0216_07160 [Bifidobacterium eulemuris]QOL35216.1 hypothetical protein BL8807_05025 [Bifidobacterium lemurum]